MKRIFFSLLVCAGFIMTSCDKDDDENTLSVTPSGTVSFSADGATATPGTTVTVTTNAKSWNASSDQSWLTVSKSSSSFTLSASNNTGDARSASVTVTAGSAKEVKISVQQSAKAAEAITLSLSPNDRFPDIYEDDDLVYTITTTASAWDAVSTHSWLTVVKSGNTLTLKANYGAVEPPPATVTVTATGAPSVEIEVSPLIRSANVTLIDISSFDGSDPHEFVGLTDFVYAGIDFEDGKRLLFRGLDAAKIAEAYNRDFFDFEASTGRYFFNGATQKYDTYYSAKYNYFIVGKMEQEYPDCYWIAGNGYSAVASKWHDDFALPADQEPVGYQGFNHFGSPTLNDWRIIFRTYMKPLGNDKFQATVWIGESNLYAGVDRDGENWYGFKSNFPANTTWSPFVNEFTSVTGGSFCASFPAAWDVATTDPEGDQGRWRITLTIEDPGPAIGSLVFEKAD